MDDGANVAAGADGGPPISQTEVQTVANFTSVPLSGGPFDGATIGPQGMLLANFIQFASPDQGLSAAGWRVVSDKGGRNDIKKKYKSAFRIAADASRPSGGTKSHISDVVLPIDGAALSHARDSALRVRPFSEADTPVRTLLLTCMGGDTKAKNGSSGGNCQHNNDSDSSWCSGQGQCDAGCLFQVLNSSDMARLRWKHMCRARILITWTLTSVVQGKAIIQFTGSHTQAGVAWAPPAPLAAGITDSALAITEQCSQKLANANQTMEQLQLSPGAGDNTRRVPPLTVVSRKQKDINYGAGAGNRRIGDWSQNDGAIRDHFLGTNEAAANKGGRDEIILYYDSSPSNYTLFVSTPFNLKLALEHGHGKDVLTDDKNDLTCYNTALTTLLGVDEKSSTTVPFAVSVSSAQGQSSASLFLKTVQLNVPCCSGCDHVYVAETMSGARYRLRRSCAGATPLSPLSVPPSPPPPPEKSNSMAWKRRQR